MIKRSASKHEMGNFEDRKKSKKFFSGKRHGYNKWREQMKNRRTSINDARSNYVTHDLRCSNQVARRVSQNLSLFDRGTKRFSGHFGW